MLPMAIGRTAPHSTVQISEKKVCRSQDGILSHAWAITFRWSPLITWPISHNPKMLAFLFGKPSGLRLGKGSESRSRSWEVSHVQGKLASQQLSYPQAKWRNLLKRLESTWKLMWYLARQVAKLTQDFPDPLMNFQKSAHFRFGCLSAKALNIML